VLPAIQFDGEFDSRAVKIQHIAFDRVLFAKPEAANLLATQIVPERLLGIGHVFAQITCGLQ